MSKKVGKMVKKLAEEVVQSPHLKLIIPAGMATPSPPLGPMLGQRNINIANFCKDFNTRTANIREGIPLPCKITVNPDRTYKLVIHKPPVTFYLHQAAGIQKGKIKEGDVAGKITLKHLYEIAVIKSEDPTLQLMSVKAICGMIIGIARWCGIEIVRELDEQEYTEFLKEREILWEQHEKELEEKMTAKLLRTG